MEVLRASGLAKTYRGAGSRAVDGVSFSVSAGEALVLAGESGSGKSTIARMILRSIEPDEGTVHVDGVRSGGDREGLARIRSCCQMMHQDPYDSVNPRMSACQIVEESLEVSGMERARRRERALEALGEAGLDPGIAERLPHTLSGGQRQRVVLARALAPRPRVIIADEPVSMLDVSVRAGILGLFSKLRSGGMAFIYITHDLATARHFGTSIAVLYRGRIVESGPASDVLLSPRHPYTAALAAAVPEPDPASRGRGVPLAEEGRELPGGCAFAPRCPHVAGKCSEDPPLAGSGGRLSACHFSLGGGPRVGVPEDL
ncbi:MAG: ABC transporter ATP-binding protein [Nitrosopumilus sp.]|nr:ABC transporter ATP-binding protein [Nitrosopumilus sp.]MDA7942970.1 ABC transporter ATP-binding protein [Nitrosopumilus sp.]MDA7952218.1 ABC transporter ATP-binding protein [Nitrosopumilus sp.]MDA7957837.1 ABC transporter ATP-binding protein [Nitrosopumilus sp.]MDA7998365.1 ABC transporter ATP-binding protein [Nitrosopumilus sp.]